MSILNKFQNFEKFSSISLLNLSNPIPSMLQLQKTNHTEWNDDDSFTYYYMLTPQRNTSLYLVGIDESNMHYYVVQKSGHTEFFCIIGGVDCHAQCNTITFDEIPKEFLISNKL